MIVIAAVAAVALQDLTALGVEASAVAGRPVTIDPRLRLPACGHAPIIAPGAGGLAIECTSPCWRIAVAGGRAAPARPVVSRGDVVTVIAGGPGFRVTVEGVADNDAAVGERVRVRDAATGARLTAVVAADGGVVLTGYTLSVPGR